MMGVGDELRRRRQELRMTQEELSRRSGIKQNTISAAETGRNNPSTETLKLLAAALGCTVADLMGEETEAFVVTPMEKQLILAYRSRPEMQAAVCTLLGIEQEAAQSAG